MFVATPCSSCKVDSCHATTSGVESAVDNSKPMCHILALIGWLGLGLVKPSFMRVHLFGFLHTNLMSVLCCRCDVNLAWCKCFECCNLFCQTCWEDHKRFPPAQSLLLVSDDNIKLVHLIAQNLTQRALCFSSITWFRYFVKSKIPETMRFDHDLKVAQHNERLLFCCPSNQSKKHGYSPSLFTNKESEICAGL